jgi:hypothetical protein
MFLGVSPSETSCLKRRGVSIFILLRKMPAPKAGVAWNDSSEPTKNPSLLVKKPGICYTFPIKRFLFGRGV